MFVDAHAGLSVVSRLHLQLLVRPRPLGAHLHRRPSTEPSASFLVSPLGVTDRPLPGTWTCGSGDAQTKGSFVVRWTSLLDMPGVPIPPWLESKDCGRSTSPERIMLPAASRLCCSCRDSPSTPP